MKLSKLRLIALKCSSASLKECLGITTVYIPTFLSRSKAFGEVETAAK
jgi:hypothetical protein